MNINKRTKAEVAVWLRDSIRTENAKTEKKIDMDLVDACMDSLSVLLDDRYSFTGEQLAEKLVQVKESRKTVTENKISEKSGTRFRRAAAVCVSVVLLCGGITVYALNPEVRNMILTAIELPIGSSVDRAGITYTYHGKETRYPDISALQENENLNIICPVGSSDAAQIREIIIPEDKSQIWIRYADNNLYTIINKADNIDLSGLVARNAERCEINNIMFYITEKEEQYLAAAVVGDWIYHIYSNNKSQIIDLLDCFK